MKSPKKINYIAESLCTRPTERAKILHRGSRPRDLITHAKYGGHRFGGFWDSGGQISPFSIELH